MLKTVKTWTCHAVQGGTSHHGVHSMGILQCDTSEYSAYTRSSAHCVLRMALTLYRLRSCSVDARSDQRRRHQPADKGSEPDG
jgi:hypothetical protein